MEGWGAQGRGQIAARPHGGAHTGVGLRSASGSSVLGLLEHGCSPERTEGVAGHMERHTRVAGAQSARLAGGHASSRRSHEQRAG